VREEQDTHIVRQVTYHDWHRVERALSTFRAQVFELEERGWRSRR
jgi:transcription initiation factor IIF auxiliary subunit